jgi:methylenetetrahydrofolate reductase (NADPH)
MSSHASAVESPAIAAELVSGGSLEMGAHRPQDARDIAALLPSGTPVYVNHLPRHRLLDTIPTLIAVRKAGLEPVPHIAARRIRDRAELQTYLVRATGDAGVRKALILGGDEAEAAGPYADGAALIREGSLASHGLGFIDRVQHIASHGVCLLLGHLNSVARLEIFSIMAYRRLHSEFRHTHLLK